MLGRAVSLGGKPRTRRTGVSIVAAVLVAAAAVMPIGVTKRAHADQRCTPIAHLVDASKIPLNGSQDPDSTSPDSRYHDQLGLNCIPTYELDFANAINDPNFPKGTCDPESAYDQAATQIKADPAWYKACKRLKFTMGPLIARPGMNDTMIHIATYDHPMYDGYAIRWKPGLQAVDGTVPPVEQLHLHHGTWIGGVNGPTAATGPFFATGEEQTILQYPKGYGWYWNGTSAWAMIYMLHNALPSPKAVYITYDIDYISSADAATLLPGGMKDTRSIWLDVGGSGGGPLTTAGNISKNDMHYYSSFNPLFNATRGHGHGDTGAFYGLTTTDGSTLSSVSQILHNEGLKNPDGSDQLVCSWPRENCADFNSAGTTSANQGIPTNTIVGNVLDVPPGALSSTPCAGIGKRCGVLVNMGGHLHPGGIRDEVALLRGNRIIPIHVSDAVYWGGPDYKHPELAGAPPKSWDLSMTGVLSWSAGTGRAKDAWKVLVEEGDKFVLNGVYDTQVGSAYDQMGIVMSWAHPGYESDAVDVFDPNTIIDAGWATGPALTPRPQGLPAAIDHSCTPGTIRAGDPDAGASGENVGKTVLCLRGNVTHGSMPSRQDHGDCRTNNTCAALTTNTIDLTGQSTVQIPMVGYNYGIFDQGTMTAKLPDGTFTGAMPKIKEGTTIVPYNPDMFAAFWHSITSCDAPCTGGTTASYPYPADGNTIADFDTTILCVGLGCGNGTPNNLWGPDNGRPFVATGKGVHTFFCRIHPFMRGAFEVV